MSLDDILILVLALVTGVLLFAGLAQALEGRPRRPHIRRSPHLPTGRRSFSAEERVLEHRARGARIGGVSPFATPPPAPVGAPPRPTWSPPERAAAPAPEQIALLDAPPSPEAPAPEAATQEMVEPSLEPLPGALDPVTPRRVSMTAPAEPVATMLMPGDTGPADPMPAVAPRHPPGDPPRDPPRDPDEAVAVAAPASLGPALVAECARLLKAGNPGELRALAEPLLKGRGRGRGRTPASYDRALLWCLVGLAHREEGEEAGLRSAFEQGIRALPKDDVSPPDPTVVPLVDSLGSRLLALGEAATDTSGATLAALRLSVGLLRGVAVCEPGQSADAADAGGPGASGGDELPPWGKALQAHLAVERARDALANTCERKVTALLERGDHVAAQKWLGEVAGWDELSGRIEGLEEPYWKVVTSEVTRLTSQALESTDDLDAAVRMLESAEAVVRGLPVSESHQMSELRRRLWWSYTKLGVQRMESGDEGAALEPLYHALRLAEGDADRETETRHSLAAGLEALAERASDAIGERLRAGDQAAAEATAQALCRAIDRGLAEGVSQEELAGALGKRQHVMERIAQTDAR